jgi:hypothetical protein
MPCSPVAKRKPVRIGDLLERWNAATEASWRSSYFIGADHGDLEAMVAFLVSRPYPPTLQEEFVLRETFAAAARASYRQRLVDLVMVPRERQRAR